MAKIEATHQFSLEQHHLEFETGGRLLVYSGTEIVQTFDCTATAVGVGIDEGNIVLGTVVFDVLSPKSFLGTLRSFTVDFQQTSQRNGGFGVIDIRDNTRTIDFDLDHEPLTIQSSANTELTTILVRPVEDAQDGEEDWYTVNDVTP